jgi:hypothetical protein
MATEPMKRAAEARETVRSRRPRPVTFAACVALLAGLIFLALPEPSRAGVHIAWEACPGQPEAARSVTFECNPPRDTLYRLVAAFEDSAAMPRIIALEGILDLAFQDSTNVPDFWHFEPGGCNSTGMFVSGTRPGAGCSGLSAALCGTSGGACQTMITAYVTADSLRNGARLFVVVARRLDSPVTLAPLPARHFAFELVFSADRSPDCAGCGRPLTITWTTANLYGVDEQGQSLKDPVVSLSGESPDSRARVWVNSAAPDSTAPPAARPRVRTVRPGRR